VQHLEYQTIEMDAGLRLDKILKRSFPGVPHSMIQKLLRKGAIRVDGKRAKADTLLQTGQIIKLPQLTSMEKPRERPPIGIEEAEIWLKSVTVAETSELIIINKPSGLATQGGSKVRQHVNAYLDALTTNPRTALKLVHRLDKDTSGLLLIAKGEKAAKNWGEAFRTRSVNKCYLALVHGVPMPRQGTIDAPLREDAKSHAVHVDETHGKKAITHYQVIDHAGKSVALVALWPETGRKHQLRAHLAAITHPIMGDPRYAEEHTLPDMLPRRMYLHAHIVSTGTMPATQAPLPDSFLAALKTLGLAYANNVAATPPF
jgi:23S rRNA pseudouridine955/2504/2580 synthase